MNFNQQHTRGPCGLLLDASKDGRKAARPLCVYVFFAFYCWQAARACCWPHCDMTDWPAADWPDDLARAGRPARVTPQPTARRACCWIGWLTVQPVADWWPVPLPLALLLLASKKHEESLGVDGQLTGQLIRLVCLGRAPGLPTALAADRLKACG